MNTAPETFEGHLDAYSKCVALNDWTSALEHIETAIVMCPSTVLLPSLAGFRSTDVRMKKQQSSWTTNVLSRMFAGRGGPA